MRRLFFTVALAALFLDQATKIWARLAADGAEGRSLFELWPGVFELKLVYNEGIAFGMFQGAGVFLTPIAAIIVAGAAWYSLRHKEEHWTTHVTMALLSAGALGNLIDRLFFGRVTDMMWVRFVDFPVFNVADACITVAGLMLGVSVVVEMSWRGHGEADGPSEAGDLDCPAPEPPQVSEPTKEQEPS